MTGSHYYKYYVCSNCKVLICALIDDGKYDVFHSAHNKYIDELDYEKYKCDELVIKNILE